ncbi:Rhamnulokinase [Propionispora sp. 2/2-37]|uniref:rhamnulokinase n=1 Tax=Propionispora sp. 2/2-37 TaxID=1677858 RepID=UPI0006BB5A09|nr:rhamnulokinase [Propionispora sp. 2/2-37]CUH94861.1 Rhamnulokinase [Propionispora sp. 2/2-37]
MKNYYLAVDIGASSGRHVLGWIENQKVCIEEIYRFENKLIEQNGHLCWDVKRLFQEVVEGIACCKRYNRIPKSIGIDTWGVDFVLLDDNHEVLGNAVAYRDSRTHGIDKKVYEIISEPELYYRNGIQKLPFNTIYQLYAVKLQNPKILKQAKNFLMIPEYINFLLTGEIKNEYTNATTTQLVHADTQEWDWELLEKLDLPKQMFGMIHLPKTVVGCLTEEVQKLVGFNTEVVLPATHDTGSAILAVPANDDDYIYLSSGTWSLMGIERRIPDCTEESRVRNFTNEGGYHYRYRYLKNIMGLWLIQSIRQEFKHPYSFDELCTLAKLGSYFSSVVDVNDASFLAPKSMIRALQDYCERTNQEKPETECELLACAYHSLAKSYADTVREIEDITGKSYSRIHIVGGGSKDDYLNKLTADYTGKEIYAGPVEATALGNILVQMLKTKDLNELREAREIIKRSFEIKKVGSEG